MPKADLALVNARVLTMDDANPRAEAVLIRGGRIALAGSTAAVRDAAGPGVPSFDCGGRTVVPGFVDGHCHFEMTCVVLSSWAQCHTPPLRSLREIAEALRRKARETPPGQWVLGRTSFSFQMKVEEGRPFTRQELDAISEDHPVGLFAGLHVAMLNTRGLRELGLWERAGSPPRGVTVHREGSGAPNGVVTEVWDLLPGASLEETRAAIRGGAQELFISQGVTTAHTIPYTSEDIRADQELQAAGELPLRLRLYYHVPRLLALDSLLATGLQPGFGDEMLRFGGVKIFVDGAGGDGLSREFADFKWTQEELDAFVTQAHLGGLQLWMHVQSIPAVMMAAKAVEAALRARPGPHGHRIEHGGDYVHRPEHIRRLRALGIRLVATPQFVYSAGDAVPEGGNFGYLRTLVDAGFQLPGNSDSTGSVPDGIAPLFNIACAVNRRTVGGRVLGPEERLTAEEGLRMYTLWAAAGGFEDGEKGSITPGKLGDLAVLSADPLAAEPEELYQIRVDATVLGGRVVYER